MSILPHQTQQIHNTGVIFTADVAIVNDFLLGSTFGVDDLRLQMFQAALLVMEYNINLQTWGIKSMLYQQ